MVGADNVTTSKESFQVVLSFTFLPLVAKFTIQISADGRIPLSINYHRAPKEFMGSQNSRLVLNSKRYCYKLFVDVIHYFSRLFRRDPLPKFKSY